MMIKYLQHKKARQEAKCTDQFICHDDPNRNQVEG